MSEPITDPEVLIEKRDGVGRIVLNRPKATRWTYRPADRGTKPVQVRPNRADAAPSDQVAG
ncbi:hypothetical protein P3H15_55165 [Rhodococcus sp. T2V]|uniref:hypothetical protein n=1 Tax=Rhodococcus sp. T2V TaxID=3034164 RepID=UPI0023E2134E|nr:hypothetical protein [Rhodococcus sp. T2V]MDF3313959.1 hypothetical protein [Rhodococcus sp. T2V]